MTIRALIAAAGLLVAASPAPAAEPDAALPAMNFVSTVARDELFALLKAHAAFARLDKELVGSPITVLIRHSLQPTATGKATGLLSAIWSGGTLGLLPAVTNNSLVVTYEVRVHGKDLATYSYRRTFTRAVNLWAKGDATYGLGKEGLEWLKSTATEFAAAAAADARLAELKREYQLYFGEPS